MGLTSRGHRTLAITGAALLLVVVSLIVAADWPRAGQSADEGDVAAEPQATPAPVLLSFPTPAPVPKLWPPLPPVVDLATLPTQNAFALQPGISIDDDPGGGFTGLIAAPKLGAIPVFASADSLQPIGALPMSNSYGATALPVVRFGDRRRAQVLLPGRQAAPSSGQLTGWVRILDVTLSPAVALVEVNLGARVIDIVYPDGSRERVSDDFAWGAPDTPTPLGRTFIMTTGPDDAAFVRGHLVVFTGQQSQTIAGFDGASLAIIAFHYYDERGGAISNGCIRLDAGQIDRMAQLPAGTPVKIYQ